MGKNDTESCSICDRKAEAFVIEFVIMVLLILDTALYFISMHEVISARPIL